MAGTFIFCTSFFQKHLPNRTARRWLKWHRYYSSRLAHFNAQRLFIIDDGSPKTLIPKTFTVVDAEKPLPKSLPAGPIVFRFRKRLGRRSMACFPGWWRSFTFAEVIAERYGYDKIIHLESDAFVTSKRLAKVLAEATRGWLAAWCARWKFPEPAIQVICADSLSKLRLFRTKSKKYWFGEEFVEHTLPFTKILRNYKGDRYGEYLRDWPTNVDYVCQALSRWNFDHALSRRLN
jgi:hypothetical protein